MILLLLLLLLLKDCFTELQSICHEYGNGRFRERK
jgi:hypothetical protein